MVKGGELKISTIFASEYFLLFIKFTAFVYRSHLFFEENDVFETSESEI